MLSTIASFGQRTGHRLDLVFANAGVSGVGGDFGDSPLSTHQTVVNVNVNGVVNTCYAAMPLLKTTPNSLCFSTCSSSAIFGVPQLAVYAATKSALESFTRGLARDLGSRKITVNLVRPGPTDTDMNPADGDLASMVTSTIPVQRYGRPEEIAKAVAFLAGPDAAFITGTGITADGGSIA